MSTDGVCAAAKLALPWDNIQGSLATSPEEQKRQVGYLQRGDWNARLEEHSASTLFHVRELQGKRNTSVKLDTRSTSDVNGSFHLNSAAAHSYFPTKDHI